MVCCKVVGGREEGQERGGFLSPGSSTKKDLLPPPIYIKYNKKNILVLMKLHGYPHINMPSGQNPALSKFHSFATHPFTSLDVKGGQSKLLITNCQRGFGVVCVF